MDERLELHDIFGAIINITEPDGDTHTYFNPPQSVVMKYPAIRYVRKKIDKRYANNAVYKFMNCYEVTVIDFDPDSEIVKKVLMLPYCEHDRSYKSNNLNHDVFTLYH